MASFVASIAALNGSPDNDDEAAFSAAVEIAYAKRQAAIESVANAAPRTLAQLIQKLTVIEEEAIDQTATMPGSDIPLPSLLASFKADILRLGP